jgi:hypothetical protein
MRKSAIQLLLLWLLAFDCNNGNENKSNNDNENHSFDSLMKYTIPINSRFSGDNSGSASGFIYTRAGKTFLVSAMHAFSGINYLNQGPTLEYDYHIDTNVLWFKSDNSNIVPLSFSISKYSEGLKTKLTIPPDLDLYKIEITIADSLKYNPINNLIDPSFFDKIPDTVIFFGFGGDYLENHHSPSEWVTAVPELALGTAISYNTFLANMNSPNRNIGTEMMNDEYLFSSKMGKTGMSGSPVFGKFTTDDHKSVVKFIGVNCWLQLDVRYSWVIKAKYVYNYLDR